MQMHAAPGNSIASADLYPSRSGCKSCSTIRRRARSSSSRLVTPGRHAAATCCTTRQARRPEERIAAISPGALIGMAMCSPVSERRGTQTLEPRPRQLRPAATLFATAQEAGVVAHEQIGLDTLEE